MHAVRLIAASSVFACGERRRQRHDVQVTDAAVVPMLVRLFRPSAVRYVQLRDLEAGCYGLRVERAGSTEAA